MRLNIHIFKKKIDKSPYEYLVIASANLCFVIPVINWLINQNINILCSQSNHQNIR